MAYAFARGRKPAAAKPAAAKPARAKPVGAKLPPPKPAPPWLEPGKGKQGEPSTPVRAESDLDVGPPRDRFEQEADRIADHAMRAPVGGSAAAPGIASIGLQRKPLTPPEEPHRGAAETMPGRHRPAPGPEQRGEHRRRATPTVDLQRATATAAVPATTTVTAEEDSRKSADCGASVLAGMQRKAADGSGPVPADVQTTVDRARVGGGAPLSPETRSDMESRLGRDFGGVRVHTGAPAASAAAAVGARAFTVGKDVFFGAGRYRPNTEPGRQLLAHELVHTVQQSGGSAGAQAARLQRASKAEATGVIAKNTDTDKDDKIFDSGKSKLGKIDANPDKDNGKRGTLYLPALRLPKVLDGLKGTADHPNPELKGVAATKPAPRKADIFSDKSFTYTGRTLRGKTLAYETWTTAMLDKGLSEKVKSRIPSVENASAESEMNVGKARVFYLIPSSQEPGKADFILTGTATEIVDPERIAARGNPSHLLAVPSWNQKGVAGIYFDADHINEEQLGGADDVSNMWLWDRKANQSAGSRVAGDITSQASKLISAARAAGFWIPGKGGAREPDVKQEIRTSWTLVFGKVEKLGDRFSQSNWTRKDILDGEHLKHLRALTDKELASEGLGTKIKGGVAPEHVHIFTSPAGGVRRRLKREKGDKSKQPGYVLADRPDGKIYKGFTLYLDAGIDYQVQDAIEEGRPIGKLKGRVFRTVKGIEFGDKFVIDIKQSRNLGFGGYVDQAAIRAAIRAAPAIVKSASPLEVTDAGINDAGELYAEAEVTASKALFPNFQFPLSIHGDELSVDVPLPAATLDLGPIHVPDASLRLGADENGVFVEGVASLVIDGLGSGQFIAAVGKGGPRISGSFDFDLAFLKDTHAIFDYDYATDAFTVKLEQDVPAKALPGVAGGHLSVVLSRGPRAGGANGAATPTTVPAAADTTGVALAGELRLAGPLAGAVVQASWDPKLGVVIAAENIPLPVAKIPGIQSATVSIHARRDPETDAWRVSGAGGAAFKIAGVAGTLLVAVDGDVVTIEGTGGFDSGPVKGSLSVLATNMQRDTDGNPLPDKPSDRFTISGKGAAEVKLGNILRGAAALEVTPDGRVIIAGEVSLPPNFPVFDKKPYNKQLLHAKTPDFPIWGISIAGYGIGVFAFGDANLDFDASVGPGVINNAHAGIKFDLDKPEDAVVDGCGDFVVSAGAGFTLDIGGGLKVKVGPAEGKGRVGLDGRLGIDAEGKAHLGIHWTRQEGLALNAAVSGEARPQFEVNANVSLTISVDLWVTDVSKTWGPWKKPLGKFGPEMQVGIGLPVAWSEAKGLDLNVDDITVTRPEISATEMMKSAFEALV